MALNASAAGGWTFTGWSGACTGTGPCDVTMTHDQSVTATFTQNIYTLTVSTTGNGTVTSTDGFISCPGTCSHSYLSNTQVTLNANPAAGWTLSAWSGACSGTGSCVVTMTQDLSVGATFTQLYYTLTVTTSGNGTVTSTDGFISCPGTCSHSYLSNTQVTLDATPGQGWVFGGWNGACIGTRSCTVTMTQPLSVDAIFSQAQQFVAITPCRVVDTRPQYGGGGPIQGGTHQDFPISGAPNCGIPASAAAYSFNVTVERNCLLPCVSGRRMGENWNRFWADDAFACASMPSSDRGRDVVDPGGAMSCQGSTSVVPISTDLCQIWQNFQVQPLTMRE